MSRYRTHRRDSNQAQIVEDIRSCGISVLNLADVGGGAGDILCGYRGVNYFFEVKNSKARKSERKLRPGQVDFHQSWRGQIARIETADEALHVMGIMSYLGR